MYVLQYVLLIVTAVYFLAYGTEEQIYSRNGKIYFSHVLDKSFHFPP